MREDTKADEMVDELRQAFAQRIRDEVGALPTHQALQLADALCDVQLDLMAGLRVTYRAKTKHDPVAIRADWVAGRTLPEIMNRHGCSRTKAYEHHPSKLKRQAS